MNPKKIASKLAHFLMPAGIRMLIKLGESKRKLSDQKIWHSSIEEYLNSESVKRKVGLRKNSIEYLLSLEPLGHKTLFREKMANMCSRSKDWAEFGVWQGKSARIWLKWMRPAQKIHLFDSWEGLPEDWTGMKLKKGEFASPIPAFKDPRVVIHKGWFEDTVPQWAKHRKEPFSMIHIDCDIYSSARTIFQNIAHLIDEDTILIFDDYTNYPNWKNHIYKAFKEYIDNNNLNFEYISKSINVTQVSVRVFLAK